MFSWWLYHGTVNGRFAWGRLREIWNDIPNAINARANHKNGEKTFLMRHVIFPSIPFAVAPLSLSLFLLQVSYLCFFSLEIMKVNWVRCQMENSHSFSVFIFTDMFRWQSIIKYFRHFTSPNLVLESSHSFFHSSVDTKSMNWIVPNAFQAAARPIVRRSPDLGVGSTIFPLQTKEWSRSRNAFLNFTTRNFIALLTMRWR